MSRPAATLRRSRAVSLVLMLCFAACIASAKDGYTEEGFQGCLDCHGNDRVMGIMDTAHAKREDPDTPAAQKACESCHGPSATHSRYPMQVENLHFGKRSNAEAKIQNRACLDCHEKRGREDWAASAHGFEHVVCSTCHGIHDPERVVPANATRISGCSASGCHDTLMGDSDSSKFTHAVGKSLGDEGELTCAGCHDPHGPLSSARCDDCHAQTPEIVARQSEKARRFHQTAAERGTECIRCHKALAHPIGPMDAEAHHDGAPALVPVEHVAAGG